MCKFKYYFIVLTASLSLFSCSKDDSPPEVVQVPPRAYQDQYNDDIKIIEDYLSSHYFIEVINPSIYDDRDVKIAKIDNGQASILSYLNAETYPKLLVRTVEIHKLKYKLYYLVLRPGVKDAPTNVDGVLVSYSGSYLSKTDETPVIKSTLFEEVKFPQDILDLYTVIRGWKEVFPQFKSGDAPEINDDGTSSHTNFGLGVMFVPSGLGYFNRASANLPAYSPLVFSFKLYKVKRLDHDVEIRGNSLIPSFDGIPSHLEDLDGDHYMWASWELPDSANGVNPDDTDKDGTPDFLDIDDDGDYYTTKLEIKDPTTNLPFSFDQIPLCSSKKKRYLDPNCLP